MNDVFVYGTLKRGFPNFADGMAGATFVAEARTLRPYPLVIAGPWHTPVVLPEPGRGLRISGEVFRVDDDILARLDRIESVHLPNGYRRETADIVIEGQSAARPAFIYTKARAHLDVIHQEGLDAYRDWRDYVPRDRRPA